MKENEVLINDDDQAADEVISSEDDMLGSDLEASAKDGETIDAANSDVVDVQAEDDDHLNWYIAQTRSNYEFKVETRVLSLIEEKKFEGRLFKVLVPMQQTVELKNNKRTEKSTKIFPGYVFIQMNIDDELAFELRQIPGVSKFVGHGNSPSPVVEDDILRVLRKVGHKSKEINVDFEVSEVIKVVDGPFRGYTGEITEINAMKGNIKANIKIFGRETPVELDFEQVEKTV